jgi:hypothetical protein
MFGEISPGSHYYLKDFKHVYYVCPGIELHELLNFATFSLLHVTLFLDFLIIITSFHLVLALVATMLQDSNWIF